jgi:hypothetical protein
MNVMMLKERRSLSPQCTSLKQRYDSCFNAWFEGYLQPALETSQRQIAVASDVAADEPKSSVPSSSISSTLPTSYMSSQDRISTNWANTFRRRSTNSLLDYPLPESRMETEALPSTELYHIPPSQPLVTAGKTRAQIKAEEYERACGESWKRYQACLKVGLSLFSGCWGTLTQLIQRAISDNTSLSTLLEQARDDHPLEGLDRLQGTPWDYNTKV